MTRKGLEISNPELLAQIESDAAKDERKRQKSLDAMLYPGLEPLIEKAREKGQQPEDIVLECNALLRDQLESTGRVDSLKRDASGASKPPVGDPPFQSGQAYV